MNVIPVLVDYLQQHTPGYSWRILSSNGLLTVYIVKEDEKTEYPCSSENVIECDKKGIFIVQSDDLLLITNSVEKVQIVDLFHPDCFQKVLGIIQSWSTFR